MLRCDLVHILKEIHPGIRFYYSMGQGLTSGIWLNLDCRCPDCMEFNKGHIFICAMPDNYVPEATILTNQNEIVDRGWRAIFRIVLKKKHCGQFVFDSSRVWKVLHKHGIWNLEPTQKIKEVTYA